MASRDPSASCSRPREIRSEEPVGLSAIRISSGAVKAACDVVTCAPLRSRVNPAGGGARRHTGGVSREGAALGRPSAACRVAGRCPGNGGLGGGLGGGQTLLATLLAVAARAGFPRGTGRASTSMWPLLLLPHAAARTARQGRASGWAGVALRSARELAAGASERSVLGRSGQGRSKLSVSARIAARSGEISRDRSDASLRERSAAGRSWSAARDAGGSSSETGRLALGGAARGHFSPSPSSSGSCT